MTRKRSVKVVDIPIIRSDVKIDVVFDASDISDEYGRTNILKSWLIDDGKNILKKGLIDDELTLSSDFLDSIPQTIFDNTVSEYDNLRGGEDSVDIMYFAFLDAESKAFDSLDVLRGDVQKCELVGDDEDVENITFDFYREQNHHFHEELQKQVEENVDPLQLLDFAIEDVKRRIYQIKDEIRSINTNVNIMKMFNKYIRQPKRVGLCVMVDDRFGGYDVKHLVMRIGYPKTYDIISDDHVFIPSRESVVEYVKGFAHDLTWERNLAVPHDKEFMKILIDDYGDNKLPSPARLVYSVPAEGDHFDTKFYPPSNPRDVVNGMNASHLHFLHDANRSDISDNPLYNLFKLSSLAIYKLLYTNDKKYYNKAHPIKDIYKGDGLFRDTIVRKVKEFKYSDFMTEKDFIIANAQYGYPENRYN